MQLVSALNWSDTAEKFGAIATQPVTLSTDPDWIFRIDGQFGQAQIRARYVQVDNLANPQQVQVIFHGNMPNTINQYSKVTIPIPDGASTVEIKLLGTPTVIFDVVARFAVNNINQTDSVNIYAITQAVKTGGLLKPINVRNGNYAIQVSDLSSVNNFVVAIPASATWPDATATAAGTGNGFWSEVWNSLTSAADVTILPSGVQTIDGAASLVLKPGQKAYLISDGSNVVSDIKRPVSGVPGGVTAGQLAKFADATGINLVAGTAGAPVAIKTVDYTVVAADVGTLLVANKATAINFNLLTAAAAGNGAIFYFENDNAGRLAINRAAADNFKTGNSQIAGPLNLSLGDSGFLVSDGVSLWRWFGYRSYDSGQQTITQAGLLTLAHGLGIQPAIVELWLHCTVANIGYAVGDEVRMQHGETPDIINNRGSSTVPDATNLTIRYGNDAAVFTFLNKGTGNTANITLADWKAIWRAAVFN